ncbi:uncharacterized protein [Miscanthus floridulus]|uniref:uncharacterized protein isoform X2 n=1 Tax=Miscanthus floridulus TaxID=154761 RepID=UPI003458D8CB
MYSFQRVAIHEAMEQQTISIAKASITTVYSIRGLQFLQLPIELQDAMMILRLTAQDKIDLQTTILSRFDLIFIVNDIRMYDQDKTREVAALISVGGAGPRRPGRQCGLEKRWWGRQCWSERRGPRKRWCGRMRPRRWRLPSPSTTTCSSPSSCHRTAGAHERDTGPIQLRCDCTNLLSLVWKKLERTMNLHLPCLCLASSVPVIDGHGNAAVQARLQFQIAEISRLSTDYLQKGCGLVFFEDDNEAFDIWHNEVGVPKERILKVDNGGYS